MKTSSSLLYALGRYYTLSPDVFMEVLNGTTSLSAIYRDIVDGIIVATIEDYRSHTASIVKLDMSGEVLCSDNIAKFADTKDDIKKMPCSVENVGVDEIAIADAINKRAMVINMRSRGLQDAILKKYYASPTADDIGFVNAVFDNDTNVSIPTIMWQYNSARYINGCRIIPRESVVIDIRNDAIFPSQVFVRQGTNVTWENNSTSPMSVYSGTTTYDDFQLSPDLTLYGEIFSSGVLQPGDSYTKKFVSVDEINWFVYPNILTGTLSITRDRISAEDQFLITENDNLDKPFSSRIIKVDSWGNVLWSLGEGYLSKPRSARPLLNNHVIIST